MADEKVSFGVASTVGHEAFWWVEKLGTAMVMLGAEN